MSESQAPSWKDPTVRDLASTARQFVQDELIGRRLEWESRQQVDRDVWRTAGRLGLLCCSIPEEHGGGGGTLAHDLAVLEAPASASEEPTSSRSKQRAGAAALGASTEPTRIASFTLPTAQRDSLAFV